MPRHLLVVGFAFFNPLSVVPAGHVGVKATDALEQMLYISNLIDFLNIQPRINMNDGLTTFPGRGEITVKQATFTYPGSNQPALKDISLSIKPGETIALVGENGAGKTTLVKLIARLYDPDEGSIWLDGVNIKELSVVSLFSKISFCISDIWSL